MTELPEPLRLANWLEQTAGASSVYRDKAAAELRRMHRELQRLAQPQMQPCAGRNCGSTNPNLHSAECFEDYEKATGMAQPEQEPVGDEEFISMVDSAGLVIDPSLAFEIKEMVEAAHGIGKNK